MNAIGGSPTLQYNNLKYLEENTMLNIANIKINIAHRYEHAIRGYAMKFESTPPAGEMASFLREAARTDGCLYPKGYRIYDTSDIAGAFSYLAGKETGNANGHEDQIVYYAPESDIATFESFFYLGERDHFLYDKKTIEDTLTEEMRKVIYEDWLPELDYAERGDGPDAIDWRSDFEGWHLLRYEIPVKMKSDTAEVDLKKVAGL
jgi:hypothetical protein